MSRFLCLAAIVFAMTLTVAAAQVAAPEKPSVFDAMAKELLARLEPPRPKKHGFVGKLIDKYKKWKGIGGPPRVAVWPFDREPVPIPKLLARSWNEALLDALVKGGSGYLRFMTRADFATLIKEVEGMDLFGKIDNPVAAVVGKAKVDVLIIGKMLAADGGVNLSYRAVDMGGEILATSGSHFMALDFAAIGAAEDSLTIDAAIDAATDHFAALGPKLKRLRVHGLLFAESGVQTSFGRYFVERFADTLQTKMDNLLSGSSLQVIDAAISPARVKKLRGMNVTAKEVDNMLAGDQVGDYLLTGSYWDLGRHVRLRLAIRNGKGQGLAWNRRIRKTSIPPGLTLVPEASGDNHGYGPIGLELTSNKGHNPVFRVGEKMTLFIYASEDVFLHCFYKQADGKTIKIFPNRYLKNNRVTGRAQLHIPSPEMPFDFTVLPPAGEERLRCFALDRDVTASLPPEVAANGQAPIPAAIADRLTRIYRGIADTRMSEIVMAVTVMDKGP